MTEAGLVRLCPHSGWSQVLLMRSHDERSPHEDGHGRLAIGHDGPPEGEPPDYWIDPADWSSLVGGLGLAQTGDKNDPEGGP